MRALIAPTVAASMLSHGACAYHTHEGGGPYRGTRMAHVVFFDLKSAPDADELIADCRRDLLNLPGVLTATCGRHLDIGRPNVDGAYDVGLVLHFANEGWYQSYLDHPKHQALVAKWKPRWDSIHIYDVQDAP